MPAAIEFHPIFWAKKNRYGCRDKICPLRISVRFPVFSGHFPFVPEAAIPAYYSGIARSASPTTKRLARTEREGGQGRRGAGATTIFSIAFWALSENFALLFSLDQTVYIIALDFQLFFQVVHQIFERPFLYSLVTCELYYHIIEILSRHGVFEPLFHGLCSRNRL